MIGARATGVLVVLVVLAAAGATATAAMTTTGTKPGGDTVPSGAHVLTWNASPSLALTGRPATVVVTNALVIREVRALVNSLGVTPTVSRICPDDLMVPTTLDFATNRSTAPFTRVVFQLGGCPYARVYQHGVAIEPTLGGARLARVYESIDQLVHPRAHPTMQK